MDEWVPASDESERAVLGAVLVNNTHLNTVRHLLRPEDFYRSAHQRIWEAVLALTADRGHLAEGDSPVDALTLSNKLAAMGELEGVGGPLYLTQLMDGVPRLTNVAYYAEIVVDRARRRELAQAASETAAEAGETSRSVNELVESLGGRIDRLKVRPGAQHEPVLESIDAFMEEVAEAIAGKTQKLGYSTGLISLDAPMGGLVPGRLITLGARPKMGKSSLLITLARAVVKQQGGVHFQSIEMPKAQCIGRFLAQEASVPLMKLVHPSPANALTEREWQRIVQAVKRIKPFADHLEVDYSASVTVPDIKAAVWASDQRRAEKDLPPCQVVVVDYLQRIKSLQPKLTRREQLNEITWQLAEWAKNENRAIIVGAQIGRYQGRDYVKKTGLPPKPRPSNLKETGSIEEDSDQVILIDRDEVHMKEQGMEPGDREGVCWYSVALNRHGPVDYGEIHFWGETTAFTERDASRAKEVWGE